MEKPTAIKEIEQNIQGEAYLDTVEPGQWPRGVFYADAYVLRSSYAHVKPSKALTSGQEERGQALTERLRARLQAEMLASGWRPVAATKEGLPIWRPAPAQPHPRIESTQTGESRQAKTIHRYTRAVTFTCQWCKEEVTEQRFPSHTPLYCSKPACKKEATRAKTRERVSAWRKDHPDARRKKPA
jgi:hypothetical protein